MPTVHRIDEFVFDCSFDSLAQANALEPEMSALLAAKLLPVIDSILNEFDEADTVWRLNQVEIDIGDIFSDDFYVELMQRVQEKLREKLLRLQGHHRPLDSASSKRLPVQRLSKLQTDLEILRDFLLTGRMPWSIDTTDRHAHENMLQQILQQQDAREAWITLLKRLTATERAVAIGRLVSQFSYRSLESVLAGIAPSDARPLLDFLRIYQQAMSAVDAKAAIQTNQIRPVWEQLFMMLLESDSLPGHLIVLLDRLVKTVALRHTQESSAMLESIGRTAAQYHQEGKISGVFHDALQTVSSLYSRHPQRESMNHSASLTYRNGSHDAARSKPEGIKSNEEIKRETQPETVVSPGRKKHARQTEAAHEELTARIMEALQKAGLIDAGFASLLMGLAPIERRQRLRGLLQSPAVKPHLPQLSQAVLLDIGYWLSPPAALLMERLLAHTSRLYQLSGTTGRTTQKYWKQQRWSAALDYLLREADSLEAIDPAGFMRALAHGVPSEAAESADAQITLRAWYEALARNEPHSIIVTLLRTLIDEVPELGKPAEESAAYSGQPLEENTLLLQQLHHRLSASKAISGQQDLTTLLQALATGHPEQLRQLCQDLRNGRYDLAAAQLSASELRSLIEKLLHIQSGAAGDDGSVFLQAIAAQADRADDQTIYYRLILENLLQEWEIDLEAIAALARQPLGKVQNDEESRGEQAGIAFKRAGEADEAEETRTAGQATSEAAAGSVVYPAGQSTKPIHTGYFALYSRITVALHEAGLIDQHPETISAEARPGELKQHLRAMLRGVTVNGWVEKLPQFVRIEIAYLLSPQAALLNEHLLAHADKLQRSIAMSAGSNRKQWGQRLWEASLNYLLTETGSDIAPADYVQALARGVSGEADPRATLRDWYGALEQSKASGTVVHTVLQAIFSAAREKDRASAAQHTSVPLAAITKTGEREDNESPETAVSSGWKKQTEAAHEELYAPIMEALQKAGLIDAVFASLSMELPPVERRQRLRNLLQSPAVRSRLPQLPPVALLDIGNWLSPSAALLNKHLLAQADKLQRSTATSAGGNRKQWEQRLWGASLSYLLTEKDSDIVPAAYLQALVRGVSGEADPQVTLRTWYDALEQSKAFGTLHTLLQTFFSDVQEQDRASAAQGTSVPPEAVIKTKKREDDGSPETAALFERGKHARQTDAAHEELTARITEALQKAGLIDAGFASLLMGLAPIERRQRMRSLLQSPAVKPRLRQLPQAALLDISYWLSPPAALLMERLLVQASRLYQLPETTGRATQKHWKQQRWSAALDYLLREADSLEAIDPAGFVRALAHGVHGEAAESADAQLTLHAWYEALVHSESHSIIVTLLRTLIDEVPEPGKPAEKSAAYGGQLPEGNTLLQQLHHRFTAGEAIPGQQDLTTLLQALATGHPEQLRQLYQDLRNGRYDLAAAQLSVSELRSLIEKRLHIQFGAAGDDGSVFLQAIAAQADRADDQATYYRLILENLLQEREIDLEAIAALARQPLGKVQNDEESRGEQAGMEAFKRAGEADEAKETRTAGQATPEAAAGSDVYPAGQSTKPIHTGQFALYSRITAALHEAGLIDQHPETISAEARHGELKQHLRAMLRGVTVNGWMEKLPQFVRMEIAYLLSPQAALLNEHLLVHADKLQRATSAGGGGKQWEQRLWSASLNYLLTETESDIVPAAYVQALARGVSGEVDPRATLRAWHEALKQSNTSAAIRTLLQTIAETSAVPSRMDRAGEENLDSSRSVAGTEGNAAAALKLPLLDWDALLHRAQSTDDVREEIYIENAGQVLAAPYLPRLFSMLKLVEDGAFVDRYAAERAVHLLQFMVNQQTRSPEYQLTLNKILCGVKTGIPICAEIDISAHEQETIEGLIRGMIQNWKTIGNTSISGLRETFLQRKGRLQLNEDGMWYLTVEPGVFDMLLDSLPWSYSVIKHSWMERAVHVTWR